MTVTAERRFATRARQHRWRRARPLLGALAAFALCALVVWALVATPVLGARAVVVSGVTTVSPEQVLRLAAVPNGTPLARIDSDGIRRRVMTLPTVASVSVDRDWPSTVRVRVVERVAVAAVQTPTGLALIDAGGTAFRDVTALPRGVGLLVAENRERRVAGLSVLAALPADLRARVTRVEVDSPTAVRLRLAGAKLVIWGEPTDNSRKSRILTALLRRSGTRYDVSTPGVVTVK